MWRIATDLINLSWSGSTVAVKSVKLGIINADTFMPIFSEDTWFLSSLTDS